MFNEGIGTAFSVGFYYYDSMMYSYDNERFVK